MQFTPARPDAVRAINQRWLLKFWTGHLDGARVPRWQSVNPNDLASLSDHLGLLDVTGDTPPRFRIRFHGHLIAKVHGPKDCRGHTLDEVLPEHVRADAIAPYAQAVQSRTPVYTIQHVSDGAGRVVQYERLLLPFAHDGKTVDRILGAYEFICDDGDFDAQALINAATSVPTLRLAVTIDMPETA